MLASWIFERLSVLADGRFFVGRPALPHFDLALTDVCQFALFERPCFSFRRLLGCLTDSSPTECAEQSVGFSSAELQLRNNRVATTET